MAEVWANLDEERRMNMMNDACKLMNGVRHVWLVYKVGLFTFGTWKRN